MRCAPRWRRATACLLGPLLWLIALVALVDKGSGTAERGVLIAAGSVLIGLVYLSLRRRARIRAGGEH